MTTEPNMPEALRLAGILEQNNQKWPHSAELKAAAELRRLHERVAELENKLQGAYDSIREHQQIVKELEQNAPRYEWLRNKTSAHQHGAWFAFGFPTAIGLPPIDNPMRGSVAQHLDAAIDAARSKEQPK